jgi:hypothetical protein
MSFVFHSVWLNGLQLAIQDKNLQLLEEDEDRDQDGNGNRNGNNSENGDGNNSENGDRNGDRDNLNGEERHLATFLKSLGEPGSEVSLSFQFMTVTD